MHANELTTVASNVFIVSDPLGNIIRGEAKGLFAADTRYLSHYDLHIEAADLVLLRSGQAGPARTDIFATNSGKRNLPPHSLELYRRRVLSNEFLETVALTNRGDVRLEFLLEIDCDSDFADIFEVRAGPEPDTSRRLAVWDDSTLILKDRRRPSGRRTHVRFSRTPDGVQRRRARFTVTIDPGETWKLDVRVRWLVPDPESTRPVPIPRTPGEDEPISEWLRHVPELETDDTELFTAYRQAVNDIAALEIALDSGHPIPAAGLPWYLAIFGRDSIITSLQCLLTGRRHAYGTLRTLAAYQSNEDSAFRDAEPGKIAHEIRFGELAMSGAIPHARYYGTVDATPLWLVLLNAADTWGSDSTVIDELLPNAEAALSWIDDFGDIDGDGLIEYQRRSEHGLENQGWKDSWDGVRFADGALAEPPIALVEVQGYVYAARLALATIYDRLGRHDDAKRLRSQARTLQRLVHQAFWMPDEGYYAIALDGRKRQVGSITSNPGHLLWCGLPEPDAAARVAERLLSPEMFSGWGIRTMATDMTAYNPFSYHNGSVWPHDNSLIIAGLARYGFADAATRLINAMLDAAACFESNRLPELFCGYARDQTPFPVDYPSACSPQAWASGSVISMLQTLAGISIENGQLRTDPLPHGRMLRITGIMFQGTHVDVDASPGRTGSRTLEQVGE